MKDLVVLVGGLKDGDAFFVERTVSYVVVPIMPAIARFIPAGEPDTVIDEVKQLNYQRTADRDRHGRIIFRIDQETSTL